MNVGPPAQERILSALEILWEKIIKIRAFVYPFLYPYHILGIVPEQP